MFPQLDQLIEQIVAVAAGDQIQRPQAEAALQRMAQQGWRLTSGIHQLWAGERNPAILTKGLDAQERTIILEALERLALSGDHPAGPPPDIPGEIEQALAALPEALQAGLRAALLAQDTTALQDAYQAALEILTPEQDNRLRQALASWASQDGPQHSASQRLELLDRLPGDVRLAVLEQDPAALQAALNALPSGQAAGLLEQLVQAGFFAQAEQQALAQTVDDLEPILQAIAVSAQDSSLPRAQIEEFLYYLEQQGLQIRQAVIAVWNGERDQARLSSDLEAQEQCIIQRLLAIIGSL